MSDDRDVPQRHQKLKPLVVIEYLAELLGYRTYLEIGVRNPADTFDRVPIETKHGVDPNPDSRATFTETSDHFFRKGHGLPVYDLIFIDGDHRELPALRDMAHSIQRLNENGTILCDNVLPLDADDARADQNGEAWKAWTYLRLSRPDLWMAVIDMRFGCGVIRRGQQNIFVPDELPYTQFRRDPPVDFEFYERYRNRILNLISMDSFTETAKEWAS